MTFIIFNLLSGIAFATPTFLPASEQTSTDQNFRDVATEINKADCTDGCTITGIITVSSHAVFNASVTINGGVFGASFAQLNATQTFSGANTFTSTATISGYGQFNSSANFKSVLELGKDSGQGNNGRQPITVWAKSFDGATQSSGCVVVLVYGTPATADSNSNATLSFTSTTTANIVRDTAVLFEDTCAPGSYCRVAIGGMVQVQMRTACASAIGQGMSTFTTRCQADCVNRGNTFAYGSFVSNTGASGWAWINLGH